MSSQQTLIGFTVSPQAKLVSKNSNELHAFVASILMQWSDDVVNLSDLEHETQIQLRLRFDSRYEVAMVDANDFEMLANEYTPSVLMTIGLGDQPNLSSLVH